MRDPGNEPRHPIAVAAERTGLSQDVLRVWERRYAAVVPSRGPGGQRLYSDADIERLRLMNATSRPGRSISLIAGMTTEALSQLAAEDAVHVRVDEPSRGAEVLAAALGHVRALEQEPLARELRRAATSLGLTAFVESVAAPLMRRIGDDWHSGWMTIAQEHLASTVVRDLLLDFMRGFTNPDGPRMIVATPAGERHEVGAAMAAASAAADGWNVVYLGADLPAAEVIAAAQAAGAKVVALSVVYGDRGPAILEEISRIRNATPAHVRVIVGGAGARALGPALRAIGVTQAEGIGAARVS